MNKWLFVLLSVFLSLPAQAEVREGYARPTYSELFQTIVMLGGLDINDTKVSDEYGRLIYCGLYEKNYGNDAAWNRVRTGIVARVQRKKEDSRVNYEIVSPFNLGRYNFEKGFFPLTPESSMNKVGTITLVTNEGRGGRCTNAASGFGKRVVFQLRSPLTVDGFTMPADRVDRTMARMAEAHNDMRLVYGRVRMTVTGVPPIAEPSRQLVLRGDVTNVDFFFDQALTKPLGSVKISLK